MTMRRIPRAFYRRNIGPGFRSTAGCQPRRALHEKSRAWLRIWSPACLCCAVGMQCDPRSLGNSPFTSVSARLQVAFYEETLGSQFPSPLCLGKGPPFPDCPSASLEFKRSSARLTPSTGDPSAPSQLHPTRAKALWAHNARIGQSSSAVQLPAATNSGGDRYCPYPQRSPSEKPDLDSTPTTARRRSLSTGINSWSIQVRPGETHKALKRRGLAPRDGLGTGCRVKRINQDDDPFLAISVQWRRIGSPPRLEPQQHPPRLLVDHRLWARVPHPLKRNRVEVKMRRRPTAMGRFRVRGRCGILTNGAPEIRVCIPSRQIIPHTTTRRIQERVQTNLPPRGKQPWTW